MDILEKIREIIVEQLDVDPEAVTPEATFLEDLGADSLDAVELVMEIENAFDISVPDEELEQLKTVQDLINVIEANS